MARNDNRPQQLSPVAQAPKGIALQRKKVDVPLTEAIEANGDTCNRITMRKPCAGDLGQCANMDEISTMLHLIHLCGTDEQGRGLPPSAVAQIDMADLGAIGEVVGNFL